MTDELLGTTHSIVVTSAAGDRQASKPNVPFEVRDPAGTTIEVFPAHRKQTMTGLGTSFTQSSAFVLAHLTPNARAQVMVNIYGATGANFTLARTHIGACDFCVEGKYSYCEVKDDVALKHFSIAADLAGFDAGQYPGVKDETFGLFAMIAQANAIKQAQGDPALSIVASAWTAPPWMKDIEDWYEKPTRANQHRGTGGELKPEYRRVYANYLVKYLDAYREQGVDIWGLTPVNEPNGNNGQWESMNFSPESQRDFIADQLGPALRASQHANTKLLVYDQNRDDLRRWADVLLSDPEASQYIYGTAVHWYDSTFKVFEDDIAAVRRDYPGFDLIHTEGCIDDLGKPAPGGILDPEGFQETDWFGNDAFWWSKRATDWAYTATWAPNAEDHPMYCPVHRYARDIIVGFDHGLSGWIDWNIVLDAQGGPNHVGNFCGAPIMIDRESGEVHYTPCYWVLGQISQTVRPGDVALATGKVLVDGSEDDLHACATVNGSGRVSVQLLNTTEAFIEVDLKLGTQVARLEVPANAVQTVQVQLAGSH